MTVNQDGVTVLTSMHMRMRIFDICIWTYCQEPMKVVARSSVPYMMELIVPYFVFDNQKGNGILIHFVMLGVEFVFAFTYLNLLQPVLGASLIF